MAKRKHRKYRRNAVGVDGLSDDRHLLDQFVRMAAESAELSRYDEAEATDEVIEQAKKYDEALWDALQAVVKKYPPENDATAEDLWNANGPYLVLMTLRGEGVGIWDGRWEEFYDDTDDVEEFLKKKLQKFADDSGSGSLEAAFTNAAFETCPCSCDSDCDGCEDGGSMMAADCPCETERER